MDGRNGGGRHAERDCWEGGRQSGGGAAAVFLGCHLETRVLLTFSHGIGEADEGRRVCRALLIQFCPALRLHIFCARFGENTNKRKIGFLERMKVSRRLVFTKNV